MGGSWVLGVWRDILGGIRSPRALLGLGIFTRIRCRF